MLDQTFSGRNLWRLLIRGDRGRFQLGESRAECRNTLVNVADAIRSDGFAFGMLRNSTQKHGEVFSTVSINDEFAIRKLNDNIRRTFSVNAADRNKIIPQVVTLCKEMNNCFLIKLDISKFFESIDRVEMLAKLFASSALSFETKRILKLLFDQPQIAATTGIPRGLAISSTLAEYYLQEFDRKCRTLECSYYSVRYVDDIPIFCHRYPIDLIEDLGASLPKGLIFNAKKTTKIALDSKGVQKPDFSSHDNVSYLGYKFAFPKSPAEKLSISIPEAKISKIKTRIIIALRDYIATRDFTLLQTRIRFLTSNFPLDGNKEVGNLYSGIFYNHRYIDEASCNVLADIDKFLVKAIFARSGSLGKRLGGVLTNKQRRLLCSNSFRRGYQQPVYRTFTNLEFRSIKEAWENA